MTQCGGGPNQQASGGQQAKPDPSTKPQPGYCQRDLGQVVAGAVADRHLRRRTTAACALAALPVLYFADPNRTRVPLCPLHAISGLWCPLCGATRASHALLHGDLVTALHDNALYVCTLPLLIWVWWRWLQAPASRPARRRLPRPMFWAAVGLAVVFGVVRNLALGRGLAPPG